ncbi:MAG: allantoate amidohydrolase [Chloroflexaceae bacterium]|nr:allantoate amidohydrolase [Chloroflexaceae bacterium]
MIATWIDQAAHVLMSRIDTLATLSEEPDGLTRSAYSPPMRHVHDLLTAWMHYAGMHVWRDNVGNLIGRYPSRNPQARAFLFGSHLDTVRNAGKYDGPLGVLGPLLCIEQLHHQGVELPFHLDLIAFIDEEGLRFHTAYLGSQAVTGHFKREYLNLVDDDGITLAEAIREFGGDPAAIALDRREPADVLGYCEVHIEQGPVLEAKNLPVGVVTSIAGQTRIALTFGGMAGHAGTVPMQMRRDALCGAAEFVLAVEAYTRQSPDMVATVGKLQTEPGVSNVIPGSVTLSLDVRHHDNDQRQVVCQLLLERAQHICTTRRLKLDWTIVHQNPATPCTLALSHLFERAVSEAGYRPHFLPSGAGHDAVAMAQLTGIAMLFVRCKDGISHHPDESVTVEDVSVALDVVDRFIGLLANHYRTHE